MTLTIYIPALKIGASGWVIKPPKGYRIRKDGAHTTSGKPHYHIYTNGLIAVINVDGTPSHRTTTEDIKNLPNGIKEFLQQECGVNISALALQFINMSILRSVKIISTIYLIEENIFTG